MDGSIVDKFLYAVILIWIGLNLLDMHYYLENKNVFSDVRTLLSAIGIALYKGSLIGAVIVLMTHQEEVKAVWTRLLQVLWS